MFKRLIALAVLMIVSVSCVQGAGPLGHDAIAVRTISDIVNGRMQVPDELRDALKDPLAQRAYEGGAIGPDLFEDAHYNNTTTPMHKLFQEAHNSMALARKSGDPEQIRQAKTELAFAYGWLNHMAVDLNLHPEVNAATGDGYKYGGKIRKAEHAEIEGAFTAYLATKGPLPPYNVTRPYVPRRLLSKVTGLSEEQIAKNEDFLAKKAKGEKAYSLTIGERGDLPGRFERALRGSKVDIAAFTRNYKSVKDWDLDCGKISTADFEKLRDDAIRLNGGKLPENFAANYMIWYERMKGLKQPKRDNVLAGLIGGNKPVNAPVAAAPKLSKPKPVALSKYEGVPKGGAWVLEKTEFVAEKCDESIMKSRMPQDSAGDGSGQSSGRFGTPDPKVFITIRVGVTWTVPDRVLIPGKGYTWRFRIADNGSDQSDGFFQASGSLGFNCPSHSMVTYDPKAGIYIRTGSPKSAENEARVEPPSGFKDDVLWVVAHWTIGIRHATVTYTYRYVMPSGK